MAVLRKAGGLKLYRAHFKVKIMLQQVEMITVLDKTALIMMHDARFDVFNCGGYEHSNLLGC